MTPQLLLDTHVLIRWLTDPARLSNSQSRALREVVRRRHTVAVSAITLLELAQISARGARAKLAATEALRELEVNQAFAVLPLTIPIAREVPRLAPVLRDPADCVIAATARVHGLRLLTSDQRLLDANVVSTID